jgi:hypothetical protein
LLLSREKGKGKGKGRAGVAGAGANVMCFVGDLGLETNWGFGND